MVGVGVGSGLGESSGGLVLDGGTEVGEPDGGLSPGALLLGVTDGP
ncbi:MAG TPA: hypothetical protein VGD91_19995 [Trebonia sp.]